MQVSFFIVNDGSWASCDIKIKLRFSPFWDVTQRKLVVTDISGQPIGPVFKGQTAQEQSWTAWPYFNMGPTDCSETSVTNY
jgi:hypothetical protein